VTDRDPKRAAAMAGAYVQELNTLVAQLSTSSARRERIFLEERLEAVKQDLESSEKDFSEFASSKGAIDIPVQGKAMVETAAALEGRLIAAQSELEGLKQIYSDNNFRVRSSEARVNELRQQLQRLSGRADNRSEAGDDPAADEPYPTLRQLPILGVPYADKMRRLKVEEAVFETLTKQYEMAKVQEAKEIPTVKVLDAPVVPEHKSFPPRLVIMIIGTICAIMVGMVWVLGHARWQEIDPDAPGKILAEEVMHTFAAHIPWISRNGAGERVPENEANEKEKN
jgi:capsule polysaccharide export protein KpsE/RkpR